MGEPRLHTAERSGRTRSPGPENLVATKHRAQTPRSMRMDIVSDAGGPFSMKIAGRLRCDAAGGFCKTAHMGVSDKDGRKGKVMLHLWTWNHTELGNLRMMTKGQKVLDIPAVPEFCPPICD